MLYGIDPLYWMLMAPVFIISMFASFKVKSSFKKYSKQRLGSGITGAEAARAILDRNGLSHIPVQKSRGLLSDHYDPSKKVVKLSESVYESSTPAAVGVAAHETGHAIQHAKSYGPLILRNMVVPFASIGSNLSWIIIFAGMFLGFLGLVKIGILLFSVVVFFQIITLPVEFNASSRAKKLVLEYNLVDSSEMRGVNSVLNSAAMTYVAAAASSVMTLIYFLLRAGLLGGSDD